MNSEQLGEMRGAAKAYPLFCLVVAGAGTSRDKRLDAYLRSTYRIVHDMSGENCLIITLEDVRGLTPNRSVENEPGVMQYLTAAKALGVERLRPFEVARHLGVPLDEIPFLVFFETATKDFLVLPLSHLEREGMGYEDAMLALFACVALAAQASSGKRIRSLLKELKGRFQTPGRLIPENLISEVVRGLAKAILDQSN